MRFAGIMKGYSIVSEHEINSPSGKKNEDNTTPLTPGKDGSFTNRSAGSEASSNQTKASTSTTIPATKKGLAPLWDYLWGDVYNLSKAERGYVVKKLPLVIPAAFLTLLGFKQLPQSIPLLNIAKEHQVASPIIGSVLLLLFLVSMIIPSFQAPKPQDAGNSSLPRPNWRIRPWVFATGISTASFVVSLALLVIVLIRPNWCPSALCLASPPLVYGPHDANLEVDFTAFQSPAYVLTKEPSQYSLSSKNLPNYDDQNSIGAVRMDERKTSSPYLVALNIHNLRSQGYSMIIEEVALVVKQTPSIPFPLNVWVQPPSQVYQSDNLYSVDYRGDGTNAVLPSTYVRMPSGHVQLNPLETDSLLLRVVPHIVAATDLRFSVQITYRIANESQRYIFAPSYVFEVVFAKASNWVPYQLQGGQLVKVNS